MNHLIKNTTIGFNLKRAICYNYLEENLSKKCFGIFEMTLAKLRLDFRILDNARHLLLIFLNTWKFIILTISFLDCFLLDPILLNIKNYFADFVNLFLIILIVVVRIRRKRGTACSPRILVGGMGRSSKFASNHILADEVFGKVSQNLNDLVRIVMKTFSDFNWLTSNDKLTKHVVFLTVVIWWVGPSCL